MKINIRNLIVKYNDKTVGYLRESENGQIGFQYDEDWIKFGFSISPLSLPLNNKVFISKSPNFGGLFGVFNDSLPDGWGELLMRRMLLAQGINFEKLSPLTRLSLVNAGGLGGLSYEPGQTEERKDTYINLDHISQEITKILEDKTEGVNLDEVFSLGGSSGGARPKAHIKIGDESWIVKFPCVIDNKNIGLDEFRANTLAQKCGINVNEYKLFDSNICPGYFGAKRFDRTKNKTV